MHKSSKKGKKENALVVIRSKTEATLHDIERDLPSFATDPEPKEGPNGHAAVKVDVEMSDDTKLVLEVKPRGALVPFANPLADEKAAKKVFKSVKKGIRSCPF